MAATILNISEIVSDPNVRGGRPVIAGTGIRVSDVVLRYTTGDKLSAEEIDEEIRRNAAEAEHWIAEARKQGKLLED